MRLCEATLKKEKIENAAAKRPNILHRRIDVPELKSSVRLKLSTEGVELIKSSGGLVKFLEQREEKKLSKKLRTLKQKLLAQGIIKAPEPEQAEEAAPTEVATAAAEAPVSEKAEAAPEATTEAEKPKEETAEQEKPQTEEKAEKQEAKPAEGTESTPAEEKASDKPADKEEEKSGS